MVRQQSGNRFAGSTIDLMFSPNSQHQQRQRHLVLLAGFLAGFALFLAPTTALAEDELSDSETLHGEELSPEIIAAPQDDDEELPPEIVAEPQDQGVVITTTEAGEVEDESTELDELVVRTTATIRGPRDIYRPSTTMEGDELTRNLSSSVPATLESVPGFHVQYNGPGATNPTIRGLPGDRVLMLEDGHRTGDIYWTAADHGVMVEPISAQRMEVIRGPAGLLYGSNALGGVVNVIRDDVPHWRPDQVEGTATAQFESVNLGGGTGLVLHGPAGPFAFTAEGTARHANDTRTPIGDLNQSGMTAFNAGLGLSWLPDWGLVGGAVRLYDNTFEIPGEFDGELIPGGHPGGVTSEARRLSGRLQAEVEEPFAVFDGLQLRTNAVRFTHEEIEGVIGDQQIIGASFDQFSTDTHLLAHYDLRSELGERDDIYHPAEGAVGAVFQTRDLNAGGASPGTRTGFERDGGLFGYQEVGLEPLRFQGALRYNYRYVTAEDLSDVRVRTQERVIIKDVEPRQFHGVAGSFAALWDFTDQWTLGSSLARSTRFPTIEELYSDGPHLADFSFDIGSPDLDAEIGHGVDLFLRSELDRVNLEMAGYYNRIDGFVHYRPTGETIRVHREGQRVRVTPVFEATSDDAEFIGAEGRVQWEFLDDLFLDLTASYTHAQRRSDGDPLPYVPPLNARMEARYDGPTFFGSVGANLGAPQRRVPGPIEVGDRSEDPMQPTDGYAIAHAMVGWNYFSSSFGHTLTFQVQNVADTVWRDHLSRIKDVAPQPGINLRLTYQAHF